MNKIIGNIIIPVMVLLFSCDKPGLFISCKDCSEEEPIQTQIDAINSSLSASGSSVLSPEAQTTLKTLSDELLQEKQSSKGIISIMKFAQTGSAVAPQSPVLYRLANLVMAGACIGFVVSLWVATSYKVQRHG